MNLLKLFNFTLCIGGDTFSFRFLGHQFHFSVFKYKNPNFISGIFCGYGIQNPNFFSLSSLFVCGTMQKIGGALGRTGGAVDRTDSELQRTDCAGLGVLWEGLVAQCKGLAVH